MNAYTAIAAVLSYLSLAKVRATATIGSAHLAIPGLWLLAAVAVLALAAVVLALLRSVIRDGGFWLAAQPAVAS